MRLGILLRQRARLLTSWFRERDFERDAQRVCWNSKSIWWVSWPRRNVASYQPRNIKSSQVFDNFLKLNYRISQNRNGMLLQLITPWPNGKCLTTKHHQTLFGDQLFWCLKSLPNISNMFYQTSSNIWTQGVVGHKITQSTTTISTWRNLRQRISHARAKHVWYTWPNITKQTEQKICLIKHHQTRWPNGKNVWSLNNVWWCLVVRHFPIGQSFISGNGVTSRRNSFFFPFFFFSIKPLLIESTLQSHKSWLDCGPNTVMLSWRWSALLSTFPFISGNIWSTRILFRVTPDSPSEKKNNNYRG